MKTSKCFDRASCSWDCKPRITGLIHDPVEESEAYLSIEKELEEKLRSYFSDKKIDSGSWFRTSVSCFESYKILGGRSKMKQVTDDKSMFFVTFVLKNLYVERSFP